MESLTHIENTLNNIIEAENDVFKKLNKFLSEGSKHIRSKVGILYLRTHNKIITDDITEILVCGELIHNASLLHDDVVDNTDERRNLPTINTIFNNNTAILSGDYLLSLAIERLIKINNKNITELFLKNTKQMIETEINQYLLRNKLSSPNEYIEICEGKTATLFECILESIAILSDLNRDEARLFGKNFGILFQLNNDIDEKSAENDLKNGVYTAYNIFGVEKTHSLMDNYKKVLINSIKSYNNKYREALEDIINKL